MAIAAAIPLLAAGMEILKKFIPDPQAQAEAQLKLMEMAQKGELEELSLRSGIVKAEAESEHWLAACWRPVLMLTFGGLIVARWFGWAAPDLTESEYLKLWGIVELGIGGYVIGRSVEKVVPPVVEALKK
jgi:hypothetical protein